MSMPLRLGSEKTGVVDYRGGNESQKCPRCGYGRNSTKGGKLLHGTPVLPETAALRTVLSEVSKAILVSSTFQAADDRKRFFMLGALAATFGGREVYLVATSKGGTDYLKLGHLDDITWHKGKWQIAPVDPPSDDSGTGWKGWSTIMGERVDLDPHIPNYSTPCAAIRLLLSLGSLNTQHRKMDSVALAEMVYIDKAAKPGPRENPDLYRTHHGSMSGSSWTARSCGPCERRIPYLICDVPKNLIE
ncbi:hypothetical protein E1287_40375 [Actinomadura sp. KC06]|uniref:hypothetical protein n=1 Tax=Actinomadura sp. KC06 TaxID=2530369 RepID=UPI00104A6C0F|nr:hypothetical protein [Actinomadura sp. KC06]TDD21759.1 hypothetical protein E1287_40375 [Actinomadura sp. KC06]